MPARKSRKANGSAKRSASISSRIIFTGLSDKQITSLRTAKEAASQQLLKPTQIMSFSALAASTSPEPSTNLVGVGIGEQNLRRQTHGGHGSKIPGADQVSRQSDSR